MKLKFWINLQNLVIGQLNKDYISEKEYHSDKYHLFKVVVELSRMLSIINGRKKVKILRTTAVFILVLSTNKMVQRRKLLTRFIF